MDVHELKRDSPREFQRQYARWVAPAVEYDWWDLVYDDFVTRMREEYALEVDPKHIQFTLYSQGAGTTFRVDMRFSRLMELTGRDQMHLPLYLASSYAGARVVIREAHNRYGIHAYVVDAPGWSEPQGVFKDMPQDDWDALVAEQYDNEDWDALAREWALDRARELHRELEVEYDYVTSEEAYTEHCLVNGIDFQEGDVS